MKRTLKPALSALLNPTPKLCVLLDGGAGAVSPCVSPVSSLMSRHCPVGIGAGSSSLGAEQRGPEDTAAKSSKQTQCPGMATVGMGPAAGASTGAHTGSTGNLQLVGLGWSQGSKCGNSSFCLVRKLGVPSGI